MPQPGSVRQKLISEKLELLKTRGSQTGGKEDTFYSHEGLYEFFRIPFGLTNAPESFQRSLDVVLAQYKGKMFLAYHDDIIFFFNSAEKHIDNINNVLNPLGKHGISQKTDKRRLQTNDNGFRKTVGF